MKFLALENEIPGTCADAFAPHLGAEAFRVWELCQAGVIRETYFRQDRSEAVLVLESTNMEEAQEILASLPLVRAGLSSFDVIPLIPYPGFSRLFAARSKLVVTCSPKIQVTLVMDGECP